VEEELTAVTKQGGALHLFYYLHSNWPDEDDAIKYQCTLVRSWGEEEKIPSFAMKCF